MNLNYKSWTIGGDTIHKPNYEALELAEHDRHEAAQIVAELTPVVAGRKAAVIRQVEDSGEYSNKAKRDEATATILGADKGYIENLNALQACKLEAEHQLIVGKNLRSWMGYMSALSKA